MTTVCWVRCSHNLFSGHDTHTHIHGHTTSLELSVCLIVYERLSVC